MKELVIRRRVVSVCQTNCFLLWEDGNSKAIVIDPGDKGAQIYEYMVTQGLEVEAILLTHGHFDHIGGVSELKQLSGATVYAHSSENIILEKLEGNLSAQFGRPCVVKPDVYWEDHAEVTLAGIVIEVIHTPGHTVGGCCYYLKDQGVLFSGDTLFMESVGRTDFPTGSMGALLRSIQNRLFVLPEETVVYPGHGDETTIGHEKMYNPFCV